MTRLRRILILSLLLVAPIPPTFAQSEDGTAPTPAPVDPVTKIKIREFRFHGSAFFIEVAWCENDPDQTVNHIDVETITDGDDLLNTDDLLTGSGQNGEPTGVLQALAGRKYCTGSYPSPSCADGIDPVEVGVIKRRLRRRLIAWLKANTEKYKDVTVN